MSIPCRAQVALILLFVVLAVSQLSGESFFGESGVSGDGFPDIYYYQETGLLQVDTDGHGMVMLSVSSEFPFVHHQNSSPCILCNNGRLQNQTWVAGFIRKSSQWIRTSPLDGPGAFGLIDLSQGPAGFTDADFEGQFDARDINQVPLTSDEYSAVFSSNDDIYFTNVSLVGGEPGEQMLLPPTDDVTSEVPESAWTNPSDPADVNNDGYVVAQDALLLINEISAFGRREFAGPQFGYFFDARSDGRLSLLDVIYTINRVNYAPRAASSYSVVPEPTGIAFTCLLGMLWLGRGSK